MSRKKRRRSWGSIKSVSKDKHILRWVENTPDGRKRRSRTLRCTYKEACFELHKIEIERSEDKPVPTIGDAYAMWYEPYLLRRVSEGKTKAGSLRAYRISWKNVIEPAWGNTPVDSVKPLKVQQWLLTLSVGNANHAVVILRKILDFAVQYETTDSNKFRMPYEMPTRKACVRRTGTYDYAQALEMLSKVHGTLVEAPFILSCFGSARTGESLGVQPHEINLVRSNGIQLATIPIMRRMDATGDCPLPDGDLKNPQSIRTLVVPEPYGTRLYNIARECISEGSGWIADRGDGLPLNMNSLKHMWEAIVGSDAIPFANLRNSWRTFAQYEWGIDNDTLEILMGHIIPGVTGKHYLRPTVDQLVDSVAKAIVQSRTT